MKLSKEEIKFIDDYLIKNKVKFWDVRLELLDHIVSAVEDKMSTDGISFNEALIEIHHNFGNRVHDGYTYNLDFEKTLYLDHKGFKKFTLKTQKEMARQHRQQFWKTFPKFLRSIPFIIEYAILIGLTYLLHQYHPKTAFIVALICCYLPEFSKVFFGVFDRFNRNSLKMQMAVNFSSLFLSLTYLSMGAFKVYFEETPQKPFVYLTVGFVSLFPFLRHGLNIYRNLFKENKQNYNLMRS